MPGPFTLSQMIDFVQRDQNDPTGKHFTDAIVTELLNEGLALFVELTRCLTATWSIDVVAGQPVYDLSTLTPKVLDVLRWGLPSAPGGTDDEPLPLRSQEWIEERDRSWRTAAAGQPECVLRFADGDQKVRLWPTPSGDFSTLSGSGGALTFSDYFGIIGSSSTLTEAEWDSYYGAVGQTYLKFGGLSLIGKCGATAMASSSDTPSIPPQFHDAPVYFANWKCTLLRKPMSQPENAPDWQGLFNSEVERCKAQTSSDYQFKPIEEAPMETF